MSLLIIMDPHSFGSLLSHILGSFLGYLIQLENIIGEVNSFHVLQ
jgi:hypothetical protein